MPTYLTPGVYLELETSLRRAGALIADWWAPGLDDEQIDALLRPLQIDLPEEARVWWRRHDGVRPDAPARAREIVPAHALLSLRDAATRYEQQRDRSPQAGPPAKRLALLSSRPDVYVECGGARDAPVPVCLARADTATRAPSPASLGDLVGDWIGLIAGGAFTTDPDGAWVDTRSGRPPAGEPR